MAEPAPAIEPASVTSNCVLERSSSTSSKISSFFAIFGDRAIGIVGRDLDARAVAQRRRHDDALVVHKRAVAAPEIDNLVLVAVMAADERVLARDERTAAQADDVVARPAHR